jgi:hypothetical protein
MWRGCDVFDASVIRFLKKEVTFTAALNVIKKTEDCVGFKILTLVDLKSSIFCDIMPCSPVGVYHVSEEGIHSIFRIKVCQ